MWWILLFFISGMLLIFSEFFLPGGILGVIGGLLILISAGMGVRSYPDYFILIIGGELLGAGVGVILGFVVLTKTRAAQLLTLNDAQTQEAGYVSAESDLSLIGKEGIVLSALRPAGTIKIGTQRIDVVSDGVFLDEGTRVVVVQVQGSRVLVEAVAQRSKQPE